MLPVLTGDEMRRADRHTIEKLGVSGDALMEQAGHAVAREIDQRWPSTRGVTVLCGRGNNGGDGFVVARCLASWRPRVYLLGTRAALSGDAARAADRFERAGGKIHEAPSTAAWREARDDALTRGVVVDAMLGTGLRQAPAEPIATAIADVAAYAAAKRGVVVAVDIPSGVAADGGVFEPAVKATLTVTFAAPKRGHVIPPGSRYAGELIVADIGIPPTALVQDGPAVSLIDASDARAAWPARDPGAHKGSCGHVLVIAGSVGKSGAATLAGVGALRAGAGLVTVATPAPCLMAIAASRPELMTEPLACDREGRGLAAAAAETALALSADRDAVVLGPGLGRSDDVRAFVRRFLDACSKPVVIDADGLFALDGSRPAVATAPRVLTPHPGEAARLLGTTTAEVQAHRIETARTLAANHRCVIVLKGEGTLVGAPDGRVAFNRTGNPGMATAGTGDVLAGVVGALVARGIDAWTAAAAGVHVHGLAGDRARDSWGEESMLALDLAQCLGRAIEEARRAR